MKKDWFQWMSHETTTHESYSIIINPLQFAITRGSPWIFLTKWLEADLVQVEPPRGEQSTESILLVVGPTMLLRGYWDMPREYSSAGLVMGQVRQSVVAMGPQLT